MDIPAPVALANNHVSSGSEVSHSSTKSSSSHTNFSDSLDDKINQLNKSQKNDVHKKSEQHVSAVVDEADGKNSVHSDKSLANNNDEHNVVVSDETERQSVATEPVNGDEVNVSHNTTLSANVENVQHQLDAEAVLLRGNALPLLDVAEGTIADSSSIPLKDQPGIFDDISATENLAFNPLGNLTAEYSFQEAAKRGVFPVAERSSGAATAFNFRDVGLPKQTADVSAEFEIGATATAQKLSELMALKGDESVKKMSQVGQQHTEVVHGVANLRNDSSSEVNLNVAAVQSALGTDISSSNKSVLSVESPVNSARWGSDLGKNIQWMVNQSINGAQIRLNPQQLGPIEIRLQMENGQATVAFTAQHAATREAIDAAMPRLREMLAGQDVNLVDVNVSQHSFAEQHQQQQGDSSEFLEANSPSEELAVNPIFAEDSNARTRAEGLVNEYV